jgi:hypothetical protein
MSRSNDHSTSPRRLGTAAVGLALALVVGACGGSSPAASPAGGATSPSPASSPAGGTTEAPGETVVPSASAAAGGGGLSEASDFCLNAADEVASIVGVPGVTASGVSNPGLGGGCMYAAPNGAPVYSISVVTGDMALSAFEGYRTSEGAEDVPGVGDAATWLLLNDVLGIAFRKGNVVASMAVLGTAPILEDEAATREGLLDLARSAAGAI